MTWSIILNYPLSSSQALRYKTHCIWMFTVIARSSLSSDVSDGVVSFKPSLNSGTISTATHQVELTSSLLTPAGGGNITFMCSRCGEHSPNPQGPTAASAHWLSVPTWVLSPPTEYFTTQPELAAPPAPAAPAAPADASLLENRWEHILPQFGSHDLVKVYDIIDAERIH